MRRFQPIFGTLRAYFQLLFFYVGFNPIVSVQFSIIPLGFLNLTFVCQSMSFNVINYFVSFQHFTVNLGPECFITPIPGQDSNLWWADLVAAGTLTTRPPHLLLCVLWLFCYTFWLFYKFTDLFAYVPLHFSFFRLIWITFRHRDLPYFALQFSIITLL